MSLDAVMARIQAISAAQQQLTAGPAAAVSQQQTQSSVNGAATTGSGTGGQTSFSQALTTAQAAATSSSGGSSPYGPFVPHGGQYGFFPAPGKDYSHGDEPEIAARLDALGKALHLHLVGLSGYRTPAHSVAVGGFANDPHTRGQASDTPGVEGVAEATLRKFGLTRPFAGAAEADHIQLA
jgi:hypothetical protein